MSSCKLDLLDDTFTMRDIDLRMMLRKRFEADHAGDAGTLVLEELGLCQHLSRVDFAVVNGELSGYEIKSDSDTLRRLPGQQSVYDRVFDRLVIVCTTRHLPEIRKIIPRWWGIYVVDTRNQECPLRVARKPRRNPNVDPRAVVQLIWRDEAIELLARVGHSGGVSRSTVDVLWERLVLSCNREDLCRMVRDTLKARVRWRSGPPSESGGGSSRRPAKSLHCRAHPVLLRIPQYSCLPN
jgi:hypothetical protein